MKELELSNRAVSRLQEIARYTLERFGPHQLDEYEGRLIARFEALARGELPHGRPCSALLGDNFLDDRLMYYLEGMHFIIFLEDAEVVQIVDLLHVSRNIPALLEGIEKDFLE